MGTEWQPHGTKTDAEYGGAVEEISEKYELMWISDRPRIRLRTNEITRTNPKSLFFQR